MWSYSAEIELKDLASNGKPVLIIKHSNRCSISAMALNRLLSEEDKINDEFEVCLVDAVENRDLSQEIARHFKVEHESPQVLVVKDNSVIYHASHLAIKPQALYSLV